MALNKCKYADNKEKLQEEMNLYMRGLHLHIQESFDYINIYKTTLEDIGDFLHCYCMAIIVYLGYTRRIGFSNQKNDYEESEVPSESYSEDDVIIDTRISKLLAYTQQTHSFLSVEQISTSNNIGSTEKDIVKNYKKELDELTYWINRALLSVSLFRGKCTRRLRITSKAEYDYYQVGKVFRF